MLRAKHDPLMKSAIFFNSVPCFNKRWRLNLRPEVALSEREKNHCIGFTDKHFDKVYIDYPSHQDNEFKVIDISSCLSGEDNILQRDECRSYLMFL
jgi:hypothetical protein